MYSQRTLHYQQLCAAHAWVAAEQAVSCLQCSWTRGEPGKQFSPHLVMKGLDFDVKFGSFTWNLNHCTYYGDTCLNLECFCARKHLSTNMWLNICEVIKVALSSETELSRFTFHIPQQQIFAVSALTNEANILCLERKKVSNLHLIKHHNLKLMRFIKFTSHKNKAIFYILEDWSNNERFRKTSLNNTGKKVMMCN